MRTQWYWVGKNGQRIELTNFTEGIESVKGAAGYGAPPLEITRQVIPGQPGARITQIRHGINEIKLPLYFQANSFTELEDLIRASIRTLDGLQGQGVLGRISTSGRVSELTCIITEGIRLDQATMVGNSACRIELTLQADNPYWLGETQELGMTGAAGKPWFPMLPLRLGSSSLLGESTITTLSDVPTYPVWAIVGPGINPVLTNLTTGSVLSFTGTTLQAGEVLVIDAREGEKVVIGPTGDNWFNRLSSRNLWALQPGLNQVNLAMGGATASSFIGLSWRDKYLTP